MAERRDQQRNRQPQQSQSGSRHTQPGAQQGGPSGARQQQQFDPQASRQPSAGSRFADQIREHMEVIDSRGQHCGTVDHVDGDRIKLTRSDSSGGQHQYLLLSQVAGIEGNKVRLRERGDNDFGMEI